MHRGNVTGVSVSSNTGYMVSGGEDCMLKVWDYEAAKTIPFFFQAFIGHTYPVSSLLFCPTDNSLVLSSGQKDGIYLWRFYGDTHTQFAMAEGKRETKRTGEKQQSMLAKLRTNMKEQKMNGIMVSKGEDTFLVPVFKQLESVDQQE